MMGEGQIMAFEAKDETVGELLNKVVFQFHEIREDMYRRKKIGKNC